MSTPYVVDSLTGYAGSNVTSWNVTLPPHIPGDLLFVLTTRNLNQAISPPSGWRILVGAAIGSSDYFQVAYKEAETQEPKTVTFTASTGERCVWVTFSVRNHLGIDATASGLTTGSSSTPSFPSVTSTQDNALILAFLGARLETTPHTPSSGYTEVDEVSYASAGSASASYVVKASAGSETPGDAAMNSSAAWGTFTLAVAPGGKANRYTLYPYKDTRILHSTWANLNFGANDRLGIGEHRSAAQIQRTLMQFESLSAIPSSTPVAECKFSFVLNTDQSDNDSTYYVYRMKRSWVEGTKTGSGTPDGATWNTYDGTNNWTTAGAFDPADCEQTAIGSFTISASASPGTRIEVDLSASVSTIADLDLGYGWLIKAANEVNDMWEINSSEHATTTDRPELFIRETPVANQQYIDIFSASETWTAPTGVTSVTVEAIGGGGKASGSPGTDQSPSVGVGGGAYAKGTVTVTPGNNYTVTVGAAIGSSTGNAQSGNPSGFVGDGGGSNQVYADGGRGLASNCIYNIMAYDGGAGGGVESANHQCGGGGGGGGAGRDSAGSAGGTGLLSGAGGAGGAGGGDNVGLGRGGNGENGGVGEGGGGGGNAGLSAPGGGGGGRGGSAPVTARNGGGGAAGEVRLLWMLAAGETHSLTASIAVATGTPALAAQIARTLAVNGPIASNTAAAVMLGIARPLVAAGAAFSGASGIAVAVARRMAGGATAAGATPDTANLTILRALSAAASLVSATPDSTPLAVYRSVTAEIAAGDATPGIAFVVRRDLAGVVAIGSSAPGAVAANIARSLNASGVAASVTPDIVPLPTLAALTANVAAVLDTSSVEAAVARPLLASAAAGSVTSDMATLVSLVGFVAAVEIASATRDAVALAVARSLGATGSAVSSTPAGMVAVVRAVAPSIAMASATPDSTELSLAALVALLAACAAGSVTPDGAQMAVARALAAQTAGATATAEVVAGIRRLQRATSQAVSAAGNIGLAVARMLVAQAPMATDSGVLALAVARQMVAAAASAGVTPEPSLAVVRALAANPAGISGTPDVVNLTTSVMWSLVAQALASTATPEGVALGVSRVLTATGTVVTATPDTILAVQRPLGVVAGAVSLTPDGVTPAWRLALSAAVMVIAGTPDALIWTIGRALTAQVAGQTSTAAAGLAVQRPLLAAGGATTGTPDTISLIAALIQGIVTVFATGKAPGTSATGKAPGVSGVSRRPNITGANNHG